MSTPSLTAQVAQCNHGNLGVAMHSQAGEVRRVPWATANVNVDENGNIGVFVPNSTVGGTNNDHEQGTCPCESIPLETINRILKETGFPTNPLP